MARGDDGYVVHGGPRQEAVAVDIDPRMLEELDALPDSRGVLRHEWTPEQDAVLLKYWTVKRQVDVARVLGMCTNSCRDRYRELTGA